MARILSQLFQERGNHGIWHKDAFKGGEFKLIRFACKDQNVKFFNLKAYCMTYTNRNTTRRQEESRHSLTLNGLSVKKYWTPKFGLIAFAHSHCTVFPGRSYLQRPPRS